MGSSCSSQSSAVLDEPSLPVLPSDGNSVVSNRWNQRRARRRQEQQLRDEVRLAEIIALQQSLVAMEDFFQSLFGQVYTEAFDPQSGGLPGPPPVKPEVYEKLPRVKTKQSCGICGECIQEKAVQLPCGHVFHHVEIEPWLKGHHCTCPVCRYELPTNDESYETGRLERMSSRKLPTLTAVLEDDRSHDAE